MTKNKIQFNFRSKTQTYFTGVFFLLAIFFMAPNFAFALVQSTHYSHIKIGAQNFWSSYLSGSESDKTSIRTWQANNIDIATGGYNLSQYNPDVLSGGYLDHVYQYPHNLYKIRSVADAHGFVFEDMLWHMGVNYQVPSSYTWSGMERFDAGEANSIGQYVNGVFILNGGAYTDKTTAAYDTTISDVAVAEDLFIGSSDPFAEINFIVATGAVGKTTTVKYWNGSSWADIASSHYTANDETTQVPNVLTDGTSGLSLTGTNTMTFFPPNDWAKTIVSGSRSKWWIRISVSGGGINPILSRIYGDNLLATDGSNNSRGWDGNDSNISNKGLGELEFNQTPPANATAKFRHQARAIGSWAHNAVFGHPSNVQNGQRTWATYIADETKNLLTTSNGKLFMFDDANGTPSITSPANALTLYSDFTGTPKTERITNLAYSRNLIQTDFPEVKVGSLTMSQEIAFAGDWNINENFVYLTSGVDGTRWNSPGGAGEYTTTYDGYLHSNNPNDTAGIIMYMDADDAGKKWQNNTVWTPWDRGNRSPLFALATYYMGANENTYFSYNAGGNNYWYFNSPGYYRYWNDSSTTLTTQLDPTIGVQTFDVYGANFSSFPSASVVSQNSVVKIKIGNQIFNTFTNLGDHLSVTGTVYETLPVDSIIQFSTENNLALNSDVTNKDIDMWGMWFPAVTADVGTPTETRNTSWKLWNASDVGGSSSSSGNIWKRDYTKALVLMRANTSSTTAAQATTASNNFCLTGGTYPSCAGPLYYPLDAKGKTGVGTTSFALRTAEGAILLKAPLGNDVTPPAAPSGLSVQ